MSATDKAAWASCKSAFGNSPVCCSGNWLIQRDTSSLFVPVISPETTLPPPLLVTVCVGNAPGGRSVQLTRIRRRYRWRILQYVIWRSRRIVRRKIWALTNWVQEVWSWTDLSYHMVNSVFVRCGCVLGFIYGLLRVSERVDAAENGLHKDVDPFSVRPGTNEACSAETFFGILSSSIVTLCGLKKMKV